VAPARVDAGALLDRAMALHQGGKLAEAESLYRQVLAADSDNFIAIQYLGVLSLQKGDAVSAEALVRKALEHQEDIPEFHSNLGLCLRAQGRLEEAVAAYRRAIWLRPDYAAAYNNLGLDLQALGRVDHAVAAFEDAIGHAPEMAEAHWNRGLALLLQGHFEKGWAEYEWRLRCQPFERHRLALPGARPWQGEALAGRTLLVRQEQGAGDTIQFIRFVPQLVAQGAHVVVEAAPSLARLLNASLPGVAVVGPDEPTTADFYVNLLSVPGRLGVTLASIPATAPYLKIVPAAAKALAPALCAKSGRRVGIVWSGNPAHANDRNRSCPPDVLDPLLSVPGCEWFSLQKGGAPMPASWAGRVIDLGSSFGDFADTAAAIDALDLIITVDTSVAHLAGALGKPVWILLPFAPDWRWLLGRDDSPWYPTARLFRQPSIGDWGAVVRDVAGELPAVRRAVMERKI
jgi:Flp pilus assembly protein TadD